MDVEAIDALWERLESMGEDERRALDPIAYALDAYRARQRVRGSVVPNRIIALACVDLMQEWDRVMSREPNL